MVTLQDVLGLPALQGARLVAGEAGREREITNVTVLDAPDGYRWLKGGELVLTSAYFFKDNPTLQSDFLNRLVDRQAAGLAIKTRRHMYEIPPDLRSLADSLCLPLLELPPEVRWSEIISGFYQLSLAGREMDRFLGVPRQKYDSLIQASGQGVQALVNAVGQLADLPVLLISGQGTVLAAGQAPAAEETAGRLRQHSAGSLPADAPAQMATPAGPFFACPVRIRGGKVTGHLLAASPALPPLESQVLLELAATLCGTELMLQRDTSRLQQRLREEFFERMLWGQGEQEVLTDHAHNLGLDAYGYTCLALVQGTEEKPAGLSGILRQAVHAADSAAVTLLYERENGEPVWLLNQPASGQEPLLGIYRRARLALEAASSQLPAGLILAVGGLYRGVAEGRRSYREARLAAELGPTLWPTRRLFFFEDLRPWSVLDRCGPEELKRIYDLHVTPLAEMDGQGHGQLMETLEAFLEHGNIKATAQALFIHENTLRYRLQNISQALRVDLNDMETRFRLWTELKVYRLAHAHH